MKITRRYIGPAERARILARSYGCCNECGTPAVTLELDHIIPLAAGGADIEGNMQPLCVKCHKAKTRREAGVTGVIAKTKRLYQKHNLTAKKKTRKWKRKLRNRGFRKDVRRRFDGTVESIAERNRRKARDKKFMKGRQW